MSRETDNGDVLDESDCLDSSLPKTLLANTTAERPEELSDEATQFV